MKVWIVCRPCVDSYYPGHPTGRAGDGVQLAADDSAFELDAAGLALGRMVHALLTGGGHKAARAEANRLIAAEPQFRFQPYPGQAGARVVETLQTVLHAYFRNDSVERCVIEAVNRGENADTTGALTGMLAGATYGVEAIPRRWLGRLDGAVKTAIETQVPALLAVARRRLAQRPVGCPA
jgi:ADP-ribosyl-[dinitrogen reductase] hydrolase